MQGGPNPVECCPGPIRLVLSSPTRRPPRQGPSPCAALIPAGLLLALAPLAPAADDYKLGPDSERHDGVPQGKVTQHKWKSKVFPGTERDYWVYVPAQYDAQDAGLRHGLPGRRRLRQTRRASSASRSSSTT